MSGHATETTHDQRHGNREGGDVGMIFRMVDDHLLRTAVGALPFADRFAASAPISLTGEPG
jgi:hypothetical protein